MKKKISNKQLAVSFYEATKELGGADLKKVIGRFASILAREHKLKKSDWIISEYLKYAKVEEGIKEIEITSARQLDEKTINAIKKSFGNKVEAKILINEDLVGGIVIKTGDIIMDASIKTQINKLKQAII